MTDKQRPTVLGIPVIVNEGLPPDTILFIPAPFAIWTDIAMTDERLVFYTRMFFRKNAAPIKIVNARADVK